MKNINDIISYLKSYDGRQIKIMEVCGTHTASIFKNGIRTLISPKIKLISGPGCPVCVTPAAYIDKCIEYAFKPNHILVTFGDMMKVPGTKGNLTQAKAEGAKVELMYSPEEIIEKAKARKDIVYVIAAVGFETTAPTYALLLASAVNERLKNIKVLTALKTVIPALDWVCSADPDIDGYISPGHVSVVIGSDAYINLAKKYNRPFAIAGFDAEHILTVIYDIVKQIEENQSSVHNLYKNVVKTEGNVKAKEIIDKYFISGTAKWRAVGSIPESGLYLREEYQAYDAGSFGLDYDNETTDVCKCGEVIIGKINPDECPMFGTGCDPVNPQGPCMVSSEGSCGIWYRNVVR